MIVAFLIRMVIRPYKLLSDNLVSCGYQIAALFIIDYAFILSDYSVTPYVLVFLVTFVIIIASSVLFFTVFIRASVKKEKKEKGPKIEKDFYKAPSRNRNKVNVDNISSPGLT